MPPPRRGGGAAGSVSQRGGGLPGAVRRVGGVRAVSEPGGETVRSRAAGAARSRRASAPFGGG